MLKVLESFRNIKPAKFQLALIRLAGILILALHLVAPLFPEKILWGAWAFSFIPWPLRLLLVTAAAFPCVPAVNKALRSGLRRILRLYPFLRSTGGRCPWRLAISLFGGLLFWTFRIRHLRWGDAKIFVEAIPHPEFRLTYNWQAPLDVFLHAKAWALANELWGWDVATVYAIISVAAGMVFVFLLLTLADEWGRNGAEKAFIFGVVTSAGFMQLFFGYIESYTIIPVGILLYLWLGVRALQSKTDPLWPALVLSITNAFHPSTLVLWPSALVILFKDGKPPISKALRIILPPVMVALSVIALMEWGKHGIKYLLGEDFPGGADRHWFVPLFHTGTVWEHYTMFSWAHFLDVLNEQLLVAPFGLVIIGIIALAHRSQAFCRIPEAFLSLAALFHFLLTFVWNPDYGGQKDWDLFAPAGIPLMLLASYLATRNLPRDELEEVGLIVISVSIVHTAVWVYSNAAPFW